jgi:hypothetical protein
LGRPTPGAQRRGRAVDNTSWALNGPANFIPPVPVSAAVK